MPQMLAALLADPALPFAFAGMLAALTVGGLVVGLQSAGGNRAVKRRLRIDPPQDGRARGRGAAAAAAGTPGAAKSRGATIADKVVQRATVFTRLSGPERTRQLKQKLVRAGFFDQGAVAAFFLARGLGAIAGLTLGFAGIGALFPGTEGSNFWMFVAAAGIAGYLAPNVYLGRRAKRVMQENRLGFPDFMDLMGVCANAGLSMEAALERVSRELADMYPVLGVHLQILCLEVRAGRAIEEALHAMADRMDIPEVRAFATLLQQSKELGSSLSDALRVFSEDMRHKRLSMAEEKAYALPAKLSVPVSACILPVVLFIAILPVIVRWNVGID